MKSFRTRPAPVLIALVLALTSTGVAGAGRSAKSQSPPRMVSPPGQIRVLTVNAHQMKVLGLKRFIALFELGRTLRDRPAAFDGGFARGVAAPDVVILQEMRPSNFEIFERLMRQRWQLRYKMYGLPNAAAQMLINIDRIEAVGDAVTWEDPCVAVDANKPRTYEYGHFRTLDTSDEFVVAGIHIAKNYRDSGQQDCFPQNIDKLREALADVTVPVVIGGDFNKRSVTEPFECDPNERSEPFAWWNLMTAPEDGGRAYVDSVKFWHREHGRSLAGEWTHEQHLASPLCDSNLPPRIRRTRIDYLFASGFAIAEAHADHPGWAGPNPGDEGTAFKYSDHRFVWGRFMFTTVAQPAPVRLAQQFGGRIAVSWDPVEGAGQYTLYRALGSAPYDELQVFDNDITFYRDQFTDDGRTYRYAVAATDTESRQGLESAGVSIEADGAGPAVVYVRPVRGGLDVPIFQKIEVHFDENLDPLSVENATVSVYRVRTGRRIGGRTRMTAPRHLVMNPSGPLRKGERYKVVVSGQRDRLSNRGQRDAWFFKTVEPPPKPPKHRRRR